MRKLTSLILLLILLSSGSALALTINGTTEVGALDQIVNSATLANSGTAEQDWIKSIFGDDYYIKYDVTESDWTKVDNTPYTYAFDLKGEPAYFFIKLGDGGINFTATHFLYENVASLMYAVVNITEWLPSGAEIPKNLNIGRVSHIGEIGTPVPEPATMLLLGLGLVGLAGYGRKKFKNN